MNQEGNLVELKRIFKSLSKEVQSMFFSATLNSEIEEIINNRLHKTFEKIVIEEQEVNLDLIDQKVMFVQKENKFKLLQDILETKKNKKIIIQGIEEVKSALIFLNTKTDADNLVRFLTNNKIKSEALHSAKSNTHRTKVINNLKSGKTKYVIATDLASRGLDIENLTHVINFDLPLKTEDYIHRIGRVGRANIKGTAYTLCSSTERNFLKKIEQLTNKKLKILTHSYHSEFALKAKGKDAKPKYKSKKNVIKKKEVRPNSKASKFTWNKK